MTRDVDRTHRVARCLRAGNVWFIDYRKSNHVALFGGFMERGIGRENGFHAVDGCTEVKTVWMDLDNTITDPFNPRA